jgi:hypothetical protein
LEGNHPLREPINLLAAARHLLMPVSRLAALGMNVVRNTQAQTNRNQLNRKHGKKPSAGERRRRLILI